MLSVEKTNNASGLLGQGLDDPFLFYSEGRRGRDLAEPRTANIQSSSDSLT